MSLDWDLTKIANSHELCWREDGTDGEGTPMYRLNSVTEALVWSTMIVGIGDLTEAVAPEFYARLYAYERVTGAMLRGPDGEGVFITPADVRAHIGLRTNVSKETKAKFAGKLLRIASEHAHREWKASLVDVTA